MRLDKKRDQQGLSINDLSNGAPPFLATLGDVAPKFTQKAVVNDEIKEVKLESYRGSWVILFFYGSNFTFV
ncbi:redoxin domain-containing protein [Bacillus tamaricis]|uniref:Redoxin domain-containing protein n=1 Tax=Evansella tamaricis TaxID=2069301 RepID=A0ABS6JM81_9BACI|nr:redoxin domain-containing protein [Evansella tamaricis]